MALHIDNPAVEQKVRRLASATGESVDDAIATAADERFARAVTRGKKSADASVEEILALVRSFKLKPVNEDLNEDQILGYGPDGICE